MVKDNRSKVVALVLILALALGITLVPLKSFGGQIETEYIHTSQKINLTAPTYSYGMSFVNSNNAVVAMGHKQLYFTIDDNPFVGYCLESMFSNPGNGSTVAYIKDHQIDKTYNFTEDAQAAVEAIAEANLDASELETLFPQSGKDSTKGDAKTRETYVKQYAIWYVIDVLDGRFATLEEYLSSLTGGLQTAYGYFNSLYAAMDDPEAEFAKADLKPGDSKYDEIIARHDYIKDLANNAYNETITAKQADLTLSIDNADYTYDKDTQSYISPVINTEIIGELENDITYTISGIDSGEYYILDLDNNIISEPTSDGFRISIPKNKILPNETKNIEISASANMKIKQYGYYASEGLTQQESFCAFTKVGKVTDSTSTYFTRSEVKGKVSIKKVDADNPNIKLIGAEFTLYDAEEEPIKIDVTNENGELSFEGLDVYGDEYGVTGIEYTLTETEAPEGYEEYDLFTTTFALTDDDKNFEIMVTNNAIKYGEIEITKVDAADSEKKLQNAEFTLYDNDFSVVKKGTTDEDGYLKFEGLDIYGDDGTGKTYTLVETNPPEGYSKADLFSETFTMTKENLSLTYTIENKTLDAVLDEIANPEDDNDDTTADEKVLGDEATDEDGTVLGEEAQTSDAMNMVPLLIVLAAVALIVLFAALQRRKREE